MKILKRTPYKHQNCIESFKKDPIQGPDWYPEFYKGPNTRTKTGFESFKKDPIQGPDWY
jgi:hypothetical protein